MKMYRDAPLIETPKSAGALPETRRQQADAHLMIYDDTTKYLTSVEAWLRIPHRSGCPALIACVGQSHEGNRRALVLMEYPEPMRYRREKATAEEHQLDRFVVDYRRAQGLDPFGSYSRGADPPDFLVRDGANSYGLDVTQLVLQERVANNDAFQDLRTAAQLRGPRKFRHLRGHVVYVTLTGEGRWKPVIDDVLDAVKMLDPRPRRKEWTPELEGETRKICPIANGAGWTTVAHLSGSTPGPFFGRMGFELIQCVASSVDAETAWELLQRLVADHDKPGTDELLVVANAPVGDGFAFPSDLVTGSLLLERADEGAVLKATHIKKIYLHSWLVRSIDVLEAGKPGAVELAVGDDLFSDQPMFIPDSSLFGDPEETITIMPSADTPNTFVRMGSDGEEDITYTRTGNTTWTRDRPAAEAAGPDDEGA